MEQIALTARWRTIVGKQVKGLRRQGLIPGIIYGHRTKPMAIELEERALEAVVAKAGRSQLVRLEIEADAQPRLVLAKEIQRDVITRSLLHVDFQEVVMDEAIVVEVPLSFVGQPLPVAEGTGLLSRGMGTLTVRCLPSALVHEIQIDLSKLAQVHDAITVADLALPSGLEILNDETTVVAQVLPLAEEEVEEEAVVAEEAVAAEAAPAPEAEEKEEEEER